MAAELLRAEPAPLLLAELSALMDRLCSNDSQLHFSTKLLEDVLGGHLQGQPPGGYSVPSPGSEVAAEQQRSTNQIYLNEPVDRGEASWNLLWARSCHRH